MSRGPRKLTPKQVLDIRNKRAVDKTPLKDLAEYYGVSRSHIGHICRGDMGRGWENIGGPISKRKYERDSPAAMRARELKIRSKSGMRNNSHAVIVNRIRKSSGSKEA